MATPTGSVESLFERLAAFCKTTFKISKLKALRIIIAVVTALVSWLCVILMISMFALIFNIGIAIWLGGLLGNAYYGYFVVAAFYFVAGVVFYFFFHKWIKKLVFDVIIKKTLQ
jgi:hypothetical protein